MTMQNEGEKVTIDRSNFLPTPDAPWDLVISRFDETLALATQMVNLLVGADGNSGYLGVLYSLIQDAPSSSVIAPSIDTTLNAPDKASVPRFDYSKLVEIPDCNQTEPALMAIPTLDLSGMINTDPPDDITSADIDWAERAYDSDIYGPVLAKLLADLVNGTTGLDPDVEAAIYARGQERQRVANDEAYQKVNEDIAARGFTLPPGALTAAIGAINAEILRQDTDLNNNIIVAQGDLAQKNAQFSVTSALRLEELIRNSFDKREDRSLEYEKSVATFAVQLYSEAIKKYLAVMEWNRTYVSTQVEGIKATSAYNTALLDEYKAKIDACSVRVDAAAKTNSNVADIFKSEMTGYGIEADSYNKDAQVDIEQLKARIQAGDMELRASIAEAENMISGYSTAAQLKEKVANDMATLAAQSLHGALNAVNAGANIGYSGSESRSEQWGHHDSLSESHGYEHDPIE